MGSKTPSRNVYLTIGAGAAGLSVVALVSLAWNNREALFTDLGSEIFFGVVPILVSAALIVRSMRRQIPVSRLNLIACVLLGAGSIVEFVGMILTGATQVSDRVQSISMSVGIAFGGLWFVGLLLYSFSRVYEAAENKGIVPS